MTKKPLILDVGNHGKPLHLLTQMAGGANLSWYYDKVHAVAPPVACAARAWAPHLPNGIIDNLAMIPASSLHILVAKCKIGGHVIHGK
jgi:hypothetical protein